MNDAIYINKLLRFTNKLKKENEILKEAITFIAKQKKSIPGHWAVVLAQKTLNELGE